ncbi:MAG: redoxin domain-containing protein [Planctomycetales bacterium]|nr:redoxin domain-containing protein [bacterium]UNM08313.1 MAG: redoxin domain-containing protein [Planctomycetales bacterium]
MKSLLLIVLLAALGMLSSCMMPDYKHQIAVNEAKLEKEGYVHPEAGQKAPAISTTDQDGAAFELSEALQAGPVVLFFYPANNTPNSANQLRQLGKLQDDLDKEGLGIRIFAINPADKAETRQFMQEEGITVPVLYDPGLKISEQYGCASKDGGTVLQERSVVGVNPDGSIAFFQRRYFHRPPGVRMLQDKEHFNLQPAVAE